MAPTQIFQHYLHIVSAESGIPEDKILSRSKEQDVVDARHILFHVLHIYIACIPPKSPASRA